MSELYLMMSILDRQDLKKFMSFYQNGGINVSLVTLCYGTAVSEVLSTLGLERREKVLLSAAVTRPVWNRLRHGLQTKMNIDLPGSGVAFIVPMSSVGGRPQLDFLTDGQEFSLEEESSLKDTEYELLTVISNIGYAERIMDAARSRGAGGGTVVHAKGTGMQGAEKFLGVSLASEKELIYIVCQKEKKNAIMQAIMDAEGVRSKAQSIVFSLPVTSTAGIKFYSPEPEE